MSSANEQPAASEARQLKQVLANVVDTFRRHQVRYALIGGMAVTVRGRSRFTRDLDFLLDIPQLKLPVLLDELVDQGFLLDIPETIAAWQHGMVQLFWQGKVRVDWLRPVVPEFGHILDRATEIMIDGRPVRVADAEGLIVLKVSAWRPQDQDDVLALLTKHAGRLDLTWIRHELARLTTPDDPSLVEFEAMVQRIEPALP